MSAAGARHVFHCPMRWGDMDAFGHVNNVAYLTYLEEARIAFLFASSEARTAAPAEGPLSEGMVVARQEIDYLAPLHWAPQPLEIHTWVERIGGASFTLVYEILGPSGAHGSPTVAARARTVLVPFSRESQAARRLTDAEREMLGRYLAPASS